MRVGIIGSGRMGTALGRRWAKAGHAVMFGSRDAAKAQGVAEQVGHGATGGSYAEAVAFGDVLLLATPWNATQSVIESLGDLGGKPLLECTNNFGESGEGSTTERVAAWAKNARVVKGFNTVFFGILESDTHAERPTIFIAGDDEAAKREISTLITDAGFDPVDAGPLANAGWLDAMAQLIVHLGYSRGQGNRIAYRLARV